MAIQKRQTKSGAVRWVARWRDKGGKEHSRSFDTKKEAKTFLADIAVRGARGLTTDYGKMTVLEMYDRWIDSRSLRDSSQGTYASTRNIQLVPLHHYPASEVTIRDINEWRRQLENGRPWISKDDKGLKPVSVRNAMLHLAAAYNWAIKEELVPRSPVTLPPATDELAVEDLPTAEEIQAVIKCVREGGAVYETQSANRRRRKVVQGPHPVLADMMELVALTGLRASEVGGLVVADVDLERMVIHVRKQISRDGSKRVVLKTVRSRRTIPLAPELEPLLRRYVTGRDQAEWVFTTPRGTPYRGNRIAEIIRYAARHVGASRVHMHSLRHFFASGLLTEGVPVQDVAAVMGHSVEVLLQTYTHVLTGHSERVSAGIASGVSRGIFAGSPHLTVIEGGA